MISSKDRSGWFGASDISFVIGKWEGKSFERWWMEKLGIRQMRFQNRYTVAGTAYEHAILMALEIPMHLDRQVKIEQIRLRVNLDGNTNDTIYECKTWKDVKPFTLPKRYWAQVQVQMYATGIRKAFIVLYPLREEEYQNVFCKIEKERIRLIPITYDRDFIESVFLPKIRILVRFLRNGSMPTMR